MKSTELTRMTKNMMKKSSCLLLRQYIMENWCGRESRILDSSGLGRGGFGGTSHLPILEGKKIVRNG